MGAAKAANGRRAKVKSFRSSERHTRHHVVQFRGQHGDACTVHVDIYNWDVISQLVRRHLDTMASQLLPLELIDKCVGSKIWVIMKGDKGEKELDILAAVSQY